MKAAALLAASARRRLGSVALLATATAATIATIGTFASAAASPSFAGLAAGKVYVRRAFEGSEVTMAVFAALSGWLFSEQYLAKRRREIALWLLSGMRIRVVLAALAIELSSACIAGFVVGIGAGLLFSRLFALILGALMQLTQIPKLIFGPQAIAVCAAACALQFLFAVARAAVDASRASIARLIRSEHEPEEAPRRKRALAALGATLIAAGYSTAIFSRGLLAENLILPALVMTVVGTFLAFDALVPALSLALRSRASSARAARLSAAAIFASAQIAFRSRRNSRILALSSILVGMAASAAGTVATVALQIRAEGTFDQDELFGALLFVGGFLAAVFALSATVLLASRSASDAREDIDRRAALRNLGATRAVMRRAIALQNAFFFGMPALFGVSHSVAAMAMLRTFSGHSTLAPAIAAGSAATAILAIAAALSTSRQLEGPIERYRIE